MAFEARIELSRGTETGSHPPAPPGIIERPVDALIRAKVLQEIRQQMPLDVLFDPKMKINLHSFIEDQIRFYNIAQWILNSGNVVGELSKIKELLKPEFDLPLLAKIFNEAVKEQPVRKFLRTALSGRIYTLNNALVAQNNPKKIAESQKNQLGSSQTLDAIRKEGHHFIKECLWIYLKPVATTAPFQTQLVACAVQLAPFVRQVTLSYLQEYEAALPEDPLRARDMRGANCHGLVAATVMEVALRVLGYASCLMECRQLEPKVTLADAHSVIFVTASDRTRYLVDPGYIQFFMDIYPLGKALPEELILVLKEADVEEFIDKKIVRVWEETEQRLKRGDASLKTDLEKADQLLSHQIDQLPFAIEQVPKDKKEWVRHSFRKVWGMKSALPVKSNLSFQEIFYGVTADKTRTFDKIHPMGFHQLAPYPRVQAKEEIDKLLQRPELRGQNSREVLSLTHLLNLEEMQRYASLFDSDPRIPPQMGINILHNAYFRSLKKIVNPESRDLRVLYGCAGADCTSVLLATDALELIFLDQSKYSFDDFKRAWASTRDPSLDQQTLKSFDEDGFLRTLSHSGGSSSITYFERRPSGKFDKLPNTMDLLPLKLFFNLKMLGVDLEKIGLEALSTTTFKITFPWCYYGRYQGAQKERIRTLFYDHARVEDPSDYSPFLKNKLKDGIDIFYMKAGYNVSLKYAQFIPTIAKAIRPQGWMMTTDRSVGMEEVDPLACLENPREFSLYQSEELQTFNQAADFPFFPMKVSPAFIIKERYNRMVSLDGRYWIILNLRQRV